MSENQLCLIPQNEIELELDEEIILVHIVRKPRKRLVLKITPEGVILSTPPHISNEKISLFLNQNKDWLLKKYKALKPIFKPKNDWVYGGRIHFMGADYKITPIISLEKPEIMNTEFLIPAINEHDKIKELCVSWLYIKALDILNQRTNYFVKITQNSFMQMKLSKSISVWGRCTSKKEIQLNWRLIHLPLRLIDYVIVHELAHLKHLNHSSKFWAEVERTLPNYLELDREIKTYSISSLI